jgi:hypothetical protein
VRRLVALTLTSVVATAATLAATVAPAAAHICPIAVEIPVAQPATIDVGVTVENATVPDVEIDIPAGLTLNRIDAKSGWTVVRTGQNLRFRGGPIAAFTCEYFSLGVTAPVQGSFGVPVVERTADGKVFARTTPDPNNATDRVLDQFVYAGVKPPSPSSGTKLPSATTMAGIGLVAIGVILVGFLGFRSWRYRGLDDEEDDDDAELDEEDRDAELRARLDRFKKRKPGPPPTD